MHNPSEKELTDLILGGALIILVLSVSIIVFLVLYQKRVLFEYQKRQFLETEYQQQLLSSSTEIQESERTRIGQDLHDEVGSTLSMLKMIVEQMPENYSNLEIKNKLKDGLSDAITSVRTIAYDLFPTFLSKFGLNEALMDLISIPFITNKSIIHFECPSNLSLPFEYQLTIYRIIQELLNNSLKHAGAQHISLHISEQGDLVYIIFKDDGCGFLDYKVAITGGGIGLKSIKTRVAILHGKISIDSQLGRGSNFEIIIPLKNNNNVC